MTEWSERGSIKAAEIDGSVYTVIPTMGVWTYAVDGVLCGQLFATEAEAKSAAEAHGEGI